MSVSGVSVPVSTSAAGTSGSGSLQLYFAQLQLEQAELAKEDATAYLDKIKNCQAEQQLCADMISRATALMEEADSQGDKAATAMPADMIEFFKSRNITFDLTGGYTTHNASEWEFNIENLSAYRDELGTETQTDMVYVEDFMGQYNSYLTGANSTIDAGNQTLQTILS